MADPFRPYKPVFTYQELKEMCRTTDLTKARESWLISHFRPPFAEYFAGKAYTFHFDNGRTLHYRFPDAHTLEWSEDGESFFDEYYEALESTVKGVFLVHHIRRRTLPFPGLTLIIDTERELVTWSDQEFGRADDCDKNVMPQLVFGWYGTPKAARHSFTTELCGAVLDWKYSDDFIIRHCYLTPDCMTSPGAPTDNEDEYLFRKTLPAAYDKLHQASRRFILVAEYYNPTPVEVSYRGHAERLFKRDFAGELLDRHADLRLLDYGFVYHRDPLFPADDISWFLLEKQP